MPRTGHPSASIRDKLQKGLLHCSCIHFRNASDYNDYYSKTSEFLEQHCPDLPENPPAITLVDSGLNQEEMVMEIDATAIVSAV